jgi:DNA-binding transcriptional LysR family regulator
MTLTQLRYIAKVAECGSITEAARQLYISQPSLSSSIRDLEGELGISIFNRSARGISLTPDGSEFLSYARQILEQTELVEQRYAHAAPAKRLFAISSQHYAFVVNAFVKLLESVEADEYEMTLRESRTYEIIEDVAGYRSELGVLYLSSFNEKVLRKLMRENHLTYTPLFDARPHVFVSDTHPFAGAESVTLTDLDAFPYLSYEQGTHNSLYFSEELLPFESHRKQIVLTDRATLFNLLRGVNGYTISSGVLNSDLNGDDIVSVPLVTDETMQLGYLTNDRARLSPMAKRYLEELRALVAANGYEVLG